MRAAVSIVCGWLTILAGALPSHAEGRVALVIGNSSYRSAPELSNPKNDAEDVGESLRRLGFETIVATDLDHSGMNEALDRFSRHVPGAEIALVYYSGHGMQFAGKNYLLPIEARLAGADDVNKFRLVPLDDIFDVLEPAQRRVVILDACRNNPLEDDLKRRLASVRGGSRDAYQTRGLGRVPASNGLIVVYATQANDVAADGSGRNSPFTSAFLRHVATPNLDVRQMLFRVQDDVNLMTSGHQRPELSVSPIGEFKLKVEAESPKPGDLTPVPSASNQGPTFDPRAMELTFWESVRNSGSDAIIQTYLDRYPDGTFASLARARIQELTEHKQQEANLSSSLIPRTFQRPSFDCSKRTEPIENLICADAELAEWDGRMGQEFQMKLKQGSITRQQQRDWITRRAVQCQMPRTGDWSVAELAPKKRCVLRIIKERVDELSSR